MPRLVRYISCLIVLWGVISTSMPVSADDSFERRYARADSLFRTWKIDKAIHLLETMARDNPDQDSTRNLLVRAYRFKGIDLYALDQYSDAVSTWRKAIKIDAKNTEINGFIGRVLMEQNLLRRYDNELDASAYLPAESHVVKTEPFAYEEPPSKTPVARKTPKSATKTATSSNIIDSNSVTDDCPIVATDFYSGLVFPVGGSALGHSAGWQLGGGLTFSTGVSSLRIGLEGIYARLPRARSDASAFDESYVSVEGVGINFLVTVLKSPTLKVKVSTGTGIYEAAVARQSLTLSTDSFDKDTKLGYTLGVRLERKLKDFNLTGSARYYDLQSGLAPNLLQFSVGISTGG